MVNCLHFRAQWRERDRLSSVDTMRIRRHLAVCQRCRAYDQQMRTSGYSLKTLAGSRG
jgi:predicted anti-sigma-YlaC factor YlaD